MGSIPITRSKYGCQAHIAQSVEHFLGKEEVTGSSPVMGSIFRLQFAQGGLSEFLALG